MRGRVWVAIGFALLVLGAPPTARQDRFAGVEIKATHVAGAVHMLEGRGGNIGVSVGEDGILIVDDQFAPLADRIRAALKKLGEGRLRFVLNTHWHGDHTGGNVEFGAEAAIIAHRNVRKRLSTRQQMGSRVFEPQPRAALPVITFHESLTVHFNGEDIRVIHFPRGHTDGDSVIFFTGSNVVHMGDDFFVNRFPFVDLDSGGDVEGLIRNVEQVLDEVPSDVKIIPGHGPLASVDDLITYHDMLLRTTQIVRDRMAEGMSVEQIQQAGLPERWASWGEGFIDTDRWLAIVHASLSK